MPLLKGRISGRGNSVRRGGRRKGQKMKMDEWLVGHSKPNRHCVYYTPEASWHESKNNDKEVRIIW